MTVEFSTWGDDLVQVDDATIDKALILGGIIRSCAFALYQPFVQL
jgi:hypothetical protein